MTDYHEGPKKKEEKKNIEKAIKGEVVVKPKGMGAKFKGVFFGGTASAALLYVVGDVILPHLRDLAFDVVTKGSGRYIYGESGYRRSRGPNEYGPITDYQRPGSVNPWARGPMLARDPRGSGPPNQGVNRWTRNRRQLDDIILVSRQDAEDVVEQLVDIVEKYDIVSLGDLYSILGLEHTPIDEKWGWSYLSNVEIRQVREGYRIDLPALEEIS